MWVYDNSNLNESYSGIVSPATYSFARRVYRQVYVQLCQLAGVSQSQIAQNDAVFSQMVTSIGGRMYYNLNNWHQMIKLLPGYQANSKFLEEMMGVDPALRGQVSPKIFKSQPLRIIYIFLKMLVIFLFMGWLVRRFLKKFESESQNISREISQTFAQNQTVEDIMVKYHDWETDLTRDFRIPIANDFAVMISVGLLRRLAGESAAARLTSGLPGIKSAEPGKQFQAILRTISQNKEVSRAVLKLPPQLAYSKIKSLLDEYIRLYGVRVPGELKLESLSFQTDPLRLISLIKNCLRHLPAVSSQATPPQTLLPGSLLVHLVSRWAQVSISRREETRFQRAVAFGLVRDILRGIGKKLKKEGQLDKENDIFYLTIEGLDNCSRPNSNYRNLVTKRRREEIAFSKLNLPSRITSSIPEVDLDQYIKKPINPNPPHSLQGTVASPGTHQQVKGEAVVMREFDITRNITGKILVTTQTDPGWTIIFPLLRGLIVERGGILSHASIVSREFNLPCIVGVTGATASIPDGRQINMDISTGKIWLQS